LDPNISKVKIDVPAKSIWIFGTNMLKGNTLGVYNPKGCNVELQEGDQILACSPLTLNLSGIMECNVVEIPWNFISRRFQNPETINEPVYFMSMDMCFHMALEHDGDMLYFRKV
jgi:hypothetical protein